MIPKLTKQILFNHFSGSTNSLQKKLIEEWLSEEGNIELYYEWLEEWERTYPQFIPDTDRAATAQLERIQGEDRSWEAPAKESVVLPSKKRWLSPAGWGKAAMVLLILGMATFQFKDRLLYKEYKTGFGELRSLSLTDNSRVVLNANSSLMVPRYGFGVDHRDVYLEGEAEFLVNRTVDNMPFTVHTSNENKVTVLGTQFVVYSRKQKMHVALNKGKVKLTAGLNPQPLLMTPGDKVSILDNGKFMLERLSDAKMNDQTAWKQHRFVFNHTSLRDITLKIHEIFGVQIMISDSLLARRELTGTFKAQNADELLSVLSEMMEIDISHQEELYLTPRINTPLP